MFFGSKKPPAPANEALNMQPEAPVPAPVSGQIIFDVGAADFEARVLIASMQKPVLVDFWAPWCGPCKQLMPVLEAAVNAAGGEVLLAKVNLDENPELAQALRVQSVPTVFAFYQGQPVNAFQGVQSPAQIKAFIDKLVQIARENAPEALNIPESLKAAAEALADRNFPVAQGLYGDILAQDEQNVEAFLGLIRTFIAAGQPEHAREMLENAPGDIARAPKFTDAKPALELAMKAPSADLAPLLEKVEQNPADHQARLDLAEAQFSSGAQEEAIETLLAAIALDKSWNEEAARKMLLTFFQALGPAHPLSMQGRKKLSTLLFS